MDRGGFISQLSRSSISDAFRSARSLSRDDDQSAGLSLFCNPKASDTMKGRKHFAGKRGFPMELSLFSKDKTSSQSGSSVSESNNERKPIMHDFLGLLENGHKVQVGEAEHDQSEEISLDLKVGYDYAPKKRKASETSANLPSSSRARGIKRRKLLNSHDGTVSLDLKLGSDPWAIRKRIEGSDTGHLARLLLAAECVKKHIFELWDAKSIENVKNKGVPVAVWDCDTESEHQLLFKRWSSGSYVLIKQWTKEFVKRRELKKGDEIGLYWDPNNSRFSFSILKRALRD